MKLKEIVMAKDALAEICKTPLKNYQKRYAVFKMCKRAEEEIKFFGEQEESLAKKYGNINEEGSVSFNSEESAREFYKERNQLIEVEVEFPSCITLNEGDMGDCSLSVAVMFSLDGFIQFVE